MTEMKKEEIEWREKSRGERESGREIVESSLYVESLHALYTATYRSKIFFFSFFLSMCLSVCAMLHTLFRDLFFSFFLVFVKFQFSLFAST